MPLRLRRGFVRPAPEGAFCPPACLPRCFENTPRALVPVSLAACPPSVPGFLLPTRVPLPLRCPLRSISCGSAPALARKVGPSPCDRGSSFVLLPLRRHPALRSRRFVRLHSDIRRVHSGFLLPFPWFRTASAALGCRRRPSAVAIAAAASRFPSFHRPVALQAQKHPSSLLPSSSIPSVPSSRTARPNSSVKLHRSLNWVISNLLFRCSGARW